MIPAPRPDYVVTWNGTKACDAYLIAPPQVSVSPAERARLEAPEVLPKTPSTTEHILAALRLRPMTMVEIAASLGIRCSGQLRALVFRLRHQGRLVAEPTTVTPRFGRRTANRYRLAGRAGNQQGAA